MDSFLDVEYGPLPQHRLDIHIPREPGIVKDAVIVFVHGGAWRAEDKAEHAQLAHRLAIRTKIPVVVPNYRLSPRESFDADVTPVLHPAHAHDALTALEFLVHSPPYQLTSRSCSIKKLYLIGHSCSAHMLASVFLDASFPELAPSLELRRAVQSIAFSEGIYDLDLLCASFPTYRAWFVEPAFGSPSLDEGYARFSAASYPIRQDCEHVRWFLVHSQADTLVDQKQTDTFHAHLISIIPGGLVERDVATITFEHNAMLRTNVYSDLMGDCILKLLGS